MKINTLNIRPVGYRYLLEKLELKVIPHWHNSYIVNSSVHHTKVKGFFVDDFYPKSYSPKDGIFEQLEFALKYDGVNFNYLSSIFATVSEKDIIKYINSKPIGKYTRRIWFFYEFLSSKILPIKDLKKGNYIEAIESDLYYTINPGMKVQRQRVINNLLGTANFCPIVRRTEILKKMELTNFHESCLKITSSYTEDTLRRALSYLYSKETRSSFAIENIKPNASRSEKFIALLKLAEQKDFCEKLSLIELQNKIVDPRFKNKDYRDKQNYIGQSIRYQKEIVHYISPKPEDVKTLMDGLLLSHQVMKEGKVYPIVHGAVISYGFVFLHPFDDGNGRIHRFLIHNILSAQGLVPKGLMFPVSATMLKDQLIYDSSLENFSKPLMELLEYRLDELGLIHIDNGTLNFYKFIDLTIQAEALFDFVSQTINDELVQELDFLVNYDKAKKSIQNIIDMPDRLIDLFIKLCQQNNGSLSDIKRQEYFDFLKDKELALMEKTLLELNKHKKNIF